MNKKHLITIFSIIFTIFIFYLCFIGYPTIALIIVIVVLMGGGLIDLMLKNKKLEKENKELKRKQQ
ncbi:MAG: hypothetical protein GF365_05510 [Candidatus Buchananbacteria bacterium]|nr:hypothetical protein [Candidatus Buchananbacteria bacterium]